MDFISFGREANIVTAETQVPGAVGRPSPWHSVHIALLREFHAQQMSAREMRDEINRQTGSNFSRNAVIAKCNRIGLPQRQLGVHPRKATDKTFRPKRERRIRPKRVSVAAEPLPIFNDADIPQAQRKSIFELKSGMCRYPVGHPGEPGFFFCGGPVLTGSYCGPHAERCYR